MNCAIPVRPRIGAIFRNHFYTAKETIMTEFYTTKMGRAFFAHQIPQLIDAVNTLAAAVSKAAIPVHLPVAADPQFLHDLYFGDYEPEVYKVTETIQRLDRTVGRAQEALTETISGDGLARLADYELALAERNSAIAEQAYESGVRTAVQMIVAGLSHSASGGKSS